MHTDLLNIVYQLGVVVFLFKDLAGNRGSFMDNLDCCPCSSQACIAESHHAFDSCWLVAIPKAIKVSLGIHCIG